MRGNYSGLHLLLFSVGLTVVVVGCETGGGFNPGPPVGWEGAGDRWWQPGVDTAKAFRSMTSLAEMGVGNSEPVYVIGGGVARQSSEDRSVYAVKQSLLPFYRNQPELVDSIFTANVESKIRSAPFPDSDFENRVSKWQKESLRSIRRVFHEPYPTKSLGKDIVIDYPDSLRTAGVSGTVVMQVSVDAEGKPDAVELLRSIHPVLDDIAMKAATQMEWQPAYLLKNSKSIAIPAWVRYNVSFTQAGG
ncbi:MAG: TonB family protein [Bacteroidetes bacterium]|nr:TonB family protein [Bacteroidota bacterium]